MEVFFLPAYLCYSKLQKNRIALRLPFVVVVLLSLCKISGEGDSDAGGGGISDFNLLNKFKKSNTETLFIR